MEGGGAGTGAGGGTGLEAVMDRAMRIFLTIGASAECTWCFFSVPFRSVPLVPALLYRTVDLRAISSGREAV